MYRGREKAFSRPRLDDAANVMLNPEYHHLVGYPASLGQIVCNDNNGVTASQAVDTGFHFR
jgi:hypothetical protein